MTDSRVVEGVFSLLNRATVVVSIALTVGTTFYLINSGGRVAEFLFTNPTLGWLNPWFAIVGIWAVYQSIVTFLAWGKTKLDNWRIRRMAREQEARKPRGWMGNS